jgi:hypothetical protein
MTQVIFLHKKISPSGKKEGVIMEETKTIKIKKICPIIGKEQELNAKFSLIKSGNSLEFYKLYKHECDFKGCKVLPCPLLADVPHNIQ